MKRIISIAAILFLVLSLAGCNSEKDKYPEPTEEFYVNDFADVIDNDEEKKFLSKAVALNKATNAQIVIVTVDDLGGDTASDYALELGRKWGIGDKEDNNGILILLAVDDREIRIEVGYGLEGDFPDSKTGRIIDVYGINHLKNDDFSTGVINIGNAVINETYLAYSLEPEEGYVNINDVKEEEQADAGKVAVSWAVLILILIIAAIISRKCGGGIFFFGGFGGHSGGNFRSGGGFGGFSGGGGSFGGGGAGRSF